MKVRRGDTLTSIAQRYNTSVGNVRSSNNLKSDLIRVNSVLRIPASGSTTPMPGRPGVHTYTVRNGDSLWQIGRKFGVSHKTLMRVNGIGPRDVLRIGQRIQIPFDSIAPSGVQAGG